MTELLLGCGHSRVKRMGLPGAPTEFQDLVTCDNNKDCSPDVLMDLSEQRVWTCADWSSQTPTTDFLDDYGRFKESFFSEIHAYEVFEHLGRQGDIVSFFSTFDNVYRILRPDGYLFGTVPSRFSPWLWGDPGHTRAILPESLAFLDQSTYQQCGKTTLSDYRSIYKSDFVIIHSSDNKVFHQFCLQAKKPARQFK